MADGKSVEVGLCGKEGFVGLPLTSGLLTSPTRVIMQVSGSAFRISAENLAISLKECPALAKALNLFSREQSLQAEQVAACNRLHEVEGPIGQMAFDVSGPPRWGRCPANAGISGS